MTRFFRLSVLLRLHSLRDQGFLVPLGGGILHRPAARAAVNRRSQRSRREAMGQYSKVETDGRLMIVTINRPEVYNACHPMANEELVAAFDEFSANPEVWVSIITASG